MKGWRWLAVPTRLLPLYSHNIGSLPDGALHQLIPLFVASLVVACGFAFTTGHDLLSRDGLGFVVGYAAGLVMITGLLVMLPMSAYAIVKNRWMPGLHRTMWVVWALLVTLTVVGSLINQGAA